MDYRRAIDNTVKYSAFFRFPLTPNEICLWLISPKPVSCSRVKPLLPTGLSAVQKKFREKVTRNSEEKTIYARKLVSVLRFAPGIKMIGITGSVSAGNAQPNDDIDLLFVTSPHVLWLVRPVVILLISLFFRRRYPGESHSESPNAFCPNLWLETVSLSVPLNKRNLYSAHEVLQVVPVLDRGNTYQLFLKRNSWTKKFLANAYKSKFRKSVISNQSSYLSYLFSPLNYLFYLLQILYMYPKKNQ